jgi:hypothetical protein
MDQVLLYANGLPPIGSVTLTLQEANAMLQKIALLQHAKRFKEVASLRATYDAAITNAGAKARKAFENEGYALY